MNCPNCGAQNRNDSSFCESCGMPLGNFNPTPPKKPNNNKKIIIIAICIAAAAVVAALLILFFVNKNSGSKASAAQSAAKGAMSEIDAEYIEAIFTDELPTETPTPTATPAPTATPEPTATPAPTETPAPKPTVTATPAPKPTQTPPTPEPGPTTTPAPLDNYGIYTVTTNDLSLRSAPGTQENRICYMNYGDTVEVLEFYQNGFYKVRYNGQVGYTLPSYLSPSPTATLPISSRRITLNYEYHLRDLPSTDADSFCIISPGETVDFYDNCTNKGRKFLLVSYNGQMGYILNEDINF